MEILDNLERLHIMQGRLLYLIQEMHLMGRLNVQEKLILKCKGKSLNILIEMAFREEKELTDIVEEFKDLQAAAPGMGQGSLSMLEKMMLRIEEYLQVRILGGEPSFDTDPPNLQASS